MEILCPIFQKKQSYKLYPEIVDPIGLHFIETKKILLSRPTLVVGETIYSNGFRQFSPIDIFIA